MNDPAAACCRAHHHEQRTHAGSTPVGSNRCDRPCSGPAPRTPSVASAPDRAISTRHTGSIRPHYSDGRLLTEGPTGMSSAGAQLSRLLSPRRLVATATAHGAAFERHRIGMTSATLPVSACPSTRRSSHQPYHRHPSQSHRASGRCHSSDRVAMSAPRSHRPRRRLRDFRRSRVCWSVAELLGRLRRPCMPAVLGNHEDDRDMPAAPTGGFVVLKDQQTQLSIRGWRR
jgi:hypothetical protein